MSDKFDRELREHLHREAEQTREFPRRLRGRIREGITPRVRTRLAPQFAVAAALVLVAAIALGVRNSQTIATLPSTLVHLLNPTPTPTPEPFVCSDRSGGVNGASSQLTSIRAAKHDGYDRVVFEFSAAVPSYDLARQASANFVRDASGAPVALDGTAGAKLTFRDTDVAASVPSDTRPALPVLREISQLGNFERVVSYGAGLSASTCVRVLELSNPSRLVVDFEASAPPSGQTPAPTPAPTATPSASASASDLGAFTCADRSGGTAGPAEQLTAVRVAHQAGYDRIVFEFAGGRVPSYTVSRQASANFVRDASGQPVNLKGSSGLRIVFHDATSNGTYAGKADVTWSLPVVQEMAGIGDFENVLSWGVGLSRPSCLRTIELSNPSRLVIDVQTP